jgi:cell division protein FtsQ
MSNAYALRDRTEGGAGRSLLRWSRPVLICLTGLCALALLARFVAEPLTRIRHVVVQSDVALADDQVLALSGLQGSDHWYSVAPLALQKRLEANPLVRAAKVEKVFPDTVRMTVWGRQPAALVLATAGGRSLPIIVDGDGIVFKVGATSQEIDLPVISGLSVGDTALGAQLPRTFVPLFADLASLRARSPSLYALVSEVRILPAAEPAISGETASGLDLLLYLTSSPVPVRVRGTIDETLVKYTLMVLDLLSKQGVLKDIQELDFRGGSVVYRMAAGTKGG